MMVAAMMNRREMLKRSGGVAASVLAGGLVKPLWASDAVEPARQRTAALAEYEKLQFGVSFHFSMNTFTGNDYETGGVPASTYNPTRLDVRQWIRVARGLGATVQGRGGAVRGADGEAHVRLLSVGVRGVRL